MLEIPTKALLAFQEPPLRLLAFGDLLLQPTVGLGKFGACIAAILAARGFDVVGVDIDAEKVRRVNAGEP